MEGARDRLDPEIREALATLPSLPVFDVRDIDAARAALRASSDAAAAAAPADPSIAVDELTALSGAGHAIGIRLFRPVSGSDPSPALLWFHGGGQVLGYAAQEDSYLMRIVREVGCYVAAVDYRLAPEARSPAAAEDGFHAYRWLREQASSLGIDVDRIGIAGASGGGGIAAATAQMIRDRGAPAPLFQSLNYPMLDDRNETSSSHEITDIGIWDRSTNVLAWQLIVGERSTSEEVSPYSAPARARTLAGLPATFVAVGELDVFRDEDIAYATRLVECGVATELHLYAGACHAWDLFAPDSALAASFFSTWFGFLSRQFRRKRAVSAP